MDQTITSILFHSSSGALGEKSPALCDESCLAVEGAVYLKSKHEPWTGERFGCPRNGHLTGSLVSSKTCPNQPRGWKGHKFTSTPGSSSGTQSLCGSPSSQETLRPTCTHCVTFPLFCSTDFEPPVHIAADRVTSPRCLPSIILVHSAFPTMFMFLGWGPEEGWDNTNLNISRLNWTFLRVQDKARSYKQ